MKKLLLFCTLVIACYLAKSQTNIKLEEIDQHIGDSVTVCGKVYGGRYLENVKNSPTMINIGAKYPDQALTLIIWGDARKEFAGQPEDNYLNKEICITGKLELYKDKPQIVIRKPAQIKVKE